MSLRWEIKQSDVTGLFAENSDNPTKWELFHKKMWYYPKPRDHPAPPDWETLVQKMCLLMQVATLQQYTTGQV